MDETSPDECGAPDAAAVDGLYALLACRHRAVMALSSGGCARYAFSMNADYCLDRSGCPLIHYSSDNAHHHLILTNSTMEMRLVAEIDPDGSELSTLILTGMLALVDPGDHESIDRYARYFDADIENYARGSDRLYRLQTQMARLELISGRRLALPLETMIRRRPWSAAEEQTLIRMVDAGLAQPGFPPVHCAGIDAAGFDLREGDLIERRLFPAPCTGFAAAEAAIGRMFATS